MCLCWYANSGVIVFVKYYHCWFFVCEDRFGVMLVCRGAESDVGLVVYSAPAWCRVASATPRCTTQLQRHEGKGVQKRR